MLPAGTTKVLFVNTQWDECFTLRVLPVKWRSGWKKNNNQTTPPLKVCRVEKPLSQDEPQVQPFRNQLFI